MPCYINKIAHPKSFSQEQKERGGARKKRELPFEPCQSGTGKILSTYIKVATGNVIRFDQRGSLLHRPFCGPSGQALRLTCTMLLLF